MNIEELSPGVRLLRKIVIIMGFVLFIGTIALIVAVYFKFTNKNKTPTEPATYYSMERNPQGKCAFKPEGNITAEGVITGTELNGNLLTVVTRKSPSSQQIMVVDLCGGNVVSKVNVSS